MISYIGFTRNAELIIYEVNANIRGELWPFE